MKFHVTPLLIALAACGGNVELPIPQPMPSDAATGLPGVKAPRFLDPSEASSPGLEACPEDGDPCPVEGAIVCMVPTEPRQGWVCSRGRWDEPASMVQCSKWCRL